MATDSVRFLSIELLGESVYQGERFLLRFRFDSSYPMDAPEVVFVTSDGYIAPEHPHVYSCVLQHNLQQPSESKAADAPCPTQKRAHLHVASRNRMEPCPKRGEPLHFDSIHARELQEEAASTRK